MTRRQGTINGGEGTTSSNQKSVFEHLALAAGLTSALSWIVLSVVALRYHPDPKFAHCSMKHNLLTMSQAFAFPIPVLLASVAAVYQSNNNDSNSVGRRLQLGLAVTFAYNFASFVWAPAFACGYDLYSTKLKAITGTVFGLSSLLYGIAWRKNTTTATEGGNIIQSITQGLWSIPPTKTTEFQVSAAPLLATATIGYLWFTIQPIVTEYPLLTIPTILGKRLSRAASAYTFLGAIVAYCLKQQAEQENTAEVNGQPQSSSLQLLKRGLGIGSGLHLLLVLLKLIGIDDGGLILPGRGLWEVYPAMMAVPFATACSLLVHFVALVGTITI